MSLKRWTTSSAIISLCLSMLSGLCNAAQPTTPLAPLQSRQGVIDLIDGNIILVNDRGYYLANNVVVKTSSGKIGRLGQLFRGRSIKMDVEYPESNGNHPIVHTIYILR
ncbi:MAG: hypothetical protein GC149_14540 [Gammaproteobacteria bacterium]|nr:hypothetical protein [Gammaproteobacteria bacterium]